MQKCFILTSPGIPTLANQIQSLHVTSHNAQARGQIKVGNGENDICDHESQEEENELICGQRENVS